MGGDRTRFLTRFLTRATGSVKERRWGPSAGAGSHRRPGSNRAVSATHVWS